MASPTEISANQLFRLIGAADQPLIVDVRTDADFDDDPRLAPGAIRWPFDAMDRLAETARGRKVVVYCQKGMKLGHGAAAALRALGVDAETLTGGQFAWRDAGLPMVAASAIPPRGAAGATTWVTRQRPKIDRIACPWLIRRFVDPDARFLFVPASEVLAVAETFQATPFDLEGVFWSHRGDRCTFDTMLEEFGLDTPALATLARIIRGADTNRHELAAESAGLLAASLGFSRMYRDDIAQLDATMPLYDALYRWARDAQDEDHDWPSVAGKSPK